MVNDSDAVVVMFGLTLNQIVDVVSGLFNRSSSVLCRCGGLVVSALDFRSGGRWFKP